MSERFFLLLLAFLATVYLYFGYRIEAPFAYDPLGPRAFPILLGSLLLVLSGAILLFHKNQSFQPGTKVIKLALTILLYFLSFPVFGFMVSTTVSVYFIARTVGSSWMEGLLTGLVLAIVFYGVFHFLLEVPLPLGFIFAVVG